MRKWICFLLCPAILFTVSGCAKTAPSGKTGSNQPAGVNDVLEQGMAEADGKNADDTVRPAESVTIIDGQKPDGTDPTAQEPSAGSGQDADPALKPAGSYESVDVDLTALSSTMVYSEVYNMMVSSEEYIGKTVKMKGLYAYYHDEATDIYYFACIIQDAAACCAQGIEFVLTDDYVYPDDYPEADEEICVVGVFDTYREGDYTYYTLRNAELI